jgi:hypothetical protein
MTGAGALTTGAGALTTGETAGVICIGQLPKHPNAGLSDGSTEGTGGVSVASWACVVVFCGCDTPTMRITSTNAALIMYKAVFDNCFLLFTALFCLVDLLLFFTLTQHYPIGQLSVNGEKVIYLD